MQEHFAKFKTNLEFDSTLATSISTRHNTLQTYLENNLPGFKDSKLIGSLQRKTRVHPGTGHQFDIDLLVVVGEFTNWVTIGGVSASTALSALHNTTYRSARYGEMNPVQDAPTVTLTYNSDNLKVELVPAYIDNIGYDQFGTQLGSIGRGYWVPTKDGTSWQMADYDYEAEYISTQNIAADAYLVPTIKMLKTIKGIYFPNFSSFPLEILAANIVPISVRVRRDAGMTITYPDLIRAFFDFAPARLTGSIGVPGSKSKPVTLDTVMVTALIKMFGDISRYIVSIDAMTNKHDKIEAWRKLCGDYFPATV